MVKQLEEIRADQRALEKKFEVMEQIRTDQQKKFDEILELLKNMQMVWPDEYLM